MFRGRCALGLELLAVRAWLLLAAALGPAIGQEPGGEVRLRPTDPDFLVRADVDRGSRSYREGDSLSLTVAAEVDAYVYVLYKQADGQVFLVFPNSSRPDNRLQARQTVAIPGGDDLFRWTVGAPFGKETIKVLASRRPLAGLADPALRAKYFNPVAPTTLKGVTLELGREPRGWAEDTIEITTYASGERQEPFGARRFGLFVGLGQYEHITRTTEGADGKRVAVYQPNHRDARMLAGLMQEVGHLSGTRILTNDEATRSKLEEAMTDWLPSASRPGDTVIVFFSGLALPISQAAKVEAKGTVLPLHDFMTAGTVEELRKQRTDNKISNRHQKQLEEAEKLAGQSSGMVAVVRQWGITDDLFAQWLQGLSGRQVIVILDAPYASQFAPQSGASPMAGGVSRLESLGQREIALLGATGEQMFDVQRDPHGLSLMTELLIETIRTAPGPVALDQAAQAVTTKLEARLAEINQKLSAAGKQPIAYKPYLMNNCTRPALLKP